MHKFFIVTSLANGGGYYGKGLTLDLASAAWRKAGGNKRDPIYREFLFWSVLPFAPLDKEATEQEADAWVDGMGGLCTLRCEKETLTEIDRRKTSKVRR